jgi:hypothetical protein
MKFHYCGMIAMIKCHEDSNQFTSCKEKPDNMTHAGPPRSHKRPQLATTIEESGRVPPFSCAHLSRDTSLGYPWVAHTLYPGIHLCRKGQVSSNSATVEATKFMGLHKSHMR